MKKKLWMLAVVALLAGCQERDNPLVSYTMPPTLEEETVQSVRPSVIVYGLESVTNGFVIHVDEREKWLVTIASAVSDHPNALIETAEGQLLRGKVVAMDTAHNIAMLTFRNSAVMEPLTLAEEMAGDSGKIGVATLTDELALTNFTSFVREGGQDVPIAVSPVTIKQLLQTALDEPLAWQERAELSQQLQDYPAIGKERLNKIDTYEKDTFLYNPDALMQRVQTFHEQLLAYMKTKNVALLDEMIYSDDLLRKLAEVTERAELQPLNIQSVALHDTVYEVIGQMETEQNKKLTITYELIKHANQWYIISLKFS